VMRLRRRHTTAPLLPGQRLHTKLTDVSPVLPALQRDAAARMDAATVGNTDWSFSASPTNDWKWVSQAFFCSKSPAVVTFIRLALFCGTAASGALG
jgi:hypothetical protein